MAAKANKRRHRLKMRIPRHLRRPLMLFAMPLAVFAGHALGGTDGMLVAAVAFPLMLTLILPNSPAIVLPVRDRQTGLPFRDRLVEEVNWHLGRGARSARRICVLAVEIDNYRSLEERFQHDDITRILSIAGLRISNALRKPDIAVRLDGPSFGIAINSEKEFTLETAMQVAGRLQSKLADRINLDGASVHLTASVGICLEERLPDACGENMVRSATAALIEARRHGPAAIRSFSSAMQDKATRRVGLAAEVGAAMKRGDIVAYFQPQVSLQTGEITGFETLARWHHAERGVIPPLEFLPALHQAGMMRDLCRHMISEGLGALKYWDELGLSVPRVGINFSPAELSDPGLFDHVRADLEHNNTEPGRLIIEVLETVIASEADHVVLRNLAALARLGCSLDLDDFGTGHASITSIRRFSIERIKIDRSFVTGIDSDPEQQKMVSAILMMAEQLGVDTLAEGIETEEEREALRHLGCGHAQGYALARPMPLQETGRWIHAYRNASDGPGLQRLGT